MRVQRLRLCAALFASAAVSACAGGLGRQTILPAVQTPAAGAVTCASAAVQPAWVFKGACQDGNIGPKGTHISLGAYKGFTVGGSVGKTDLKAKSPFTIVDATGNHDIEKYQHKAFPRYSVRGSTTRLYLEVVNGGAKPIAIKGKPAITLTIADAGTISSQCGLALLAQSKGSYTWTALPVPVTPVKSGYHIKIGSLPIALEPGAAYLALSCSKTAPSPTPSSSPTPSPTPGTSVKIYSVSSDGAINGITAGPDGNMWFTENGMHAIGKITPNGTVTSYPVNAYTASSFAERVTPTQIVKGSDGKLWFIGNDNYTAGGCGCILSSTTNGTIAYYQIPQAQACGDASATAIAPGPDDNIWFAVDGITSGVGCSHIGKFSITNHTFALYDAGNNDGEVFGMTAGPDGNVWFTDDKGYIGRMTTSGTLTKFAFAGYTAGSQPSGITAGQDGALWFTYGPPSGSAPTGIARITTTGTITQTSTASTDYCQGPFGPDPIVSAPDGYLWFGCDYNLARSSTSGHVTDYSTLLYSAGALINNMAWGADGNLWLAGNDEIAKFTP